MIIIKYTKKILKLMMAALLLSVAITSFFVLRKHLPKPYMIDWEWNETIACHYVTEGDALPSAEDLSPPENSIFFHETTCRGGLNSREACAIESAARKHPNHLVYVFFNSPVLEVVLTKSCLAKLTEFKNVRLARLHTAEYAKGTALSEMLAHKENDRSSWRIELTSDMLRYITMYKYGGVYLDTDVLVVKPLDSLGKNWVAREDDQTVNVACLAVSKKGLGHELVAKVLKEIKSDYRPSEWLYNGPGAMTRVLLKFCNATRVADLTSRICHGFQVYNASLIYPVSYVYADYYFKAGELAVERGEALTHHMWNKMSRDRPLEAGSPYDRMTRQHCPSIREMYGNQFGL